MTLTQVERTKMSRIMSEYGRRRGKATARRMRPDERSARASKAALAAAANMTAEERTARALR